MITQSIYPDLRAMTTFGLPAPVGRLLQFDDPARDLPQLDRDGALHGALILGGGSNMLFTAPAPGLTVIHPTARAINFLPSPNPEWAIVEAQAAVPLDDFCRIMAEHGLWGTENLSGIPGEIGGATVQNVGAYGAEFKDVMLSATCWSTRTHSFVTLSNEECRYGYRDSIFKHLAPEERLIVCSVCMQLSRAPRPNLTYKGLRSPLAAAAGMPADVPEAVLARVYAFQSPMTIRNTVTEVRRSKLPDPAQTGSAGSFFKNPVVSQSTLGEIEARIAAINLNAGSEIVPPLSYHAMPDGSAKLSAAWLIDKAGCKPITCGGAALWPSQPLVIVNASGNATGKDVVNLEKMIIARVYETFGVTLIPEVIHIR